MNTVYFASAGASLSAMMDPEPVLRLGYPYIWNAGLGFGWRL